MGVAGRHEDLIAAGGGLRREAIKKLGAKYPPPLNMSPEQAQGLIYELAIHEIELQMQNEQLHRSQKLADESKRKFAVLYDFAPIGYLTLSRSGKIIEANLAAARELGVERGQLVETFLGNHSVGKGKRQLMSHLRRVSLTQQRESCEMEFLAEGGRRFHACLESIPWRGEDGVEVYLTSLMDISQRKQAEVIHLKTSAALLQQIEERRKTQQRLQMTELRLRALSAKLLEAAEEERRRISREIHDSIGSSLTAIKMFLSNALTQAEQGHLKAEDLQKIITLTWTTSCEVRRIIADLRPAVLDDFGIVTAVRWFCREMLELHPNLNLEVNIGIEEDAVPEPLKIVIFRILQESFQNICKYSKAQSVEVRFGTTDSHIELRIADDGTGFDTESACHQIAHGGMGLIGMRERTQLSGGIFAVRSRPGHGTVIDASWPVAE